MIPTKRPSRHARPSHLRLVPPPAPLQDDAGELEVRGFETAAEDSSPARRAHLARASFIDAVTMLEHTLFSAWRALVVATRVCARLGRIAARAEWTARTTVSTVPSGESVVRPHPIRGG
jgi:uncharacterized protein YciW